MHFLKLPKYCGITGKPKATGKPGGAGPGAEGAAQLDNGSISDIG